MTLPKNFIFLEKIDSTIIQAPRYATSENFIGRPLRGYENPRLILTQQAAEALHQVQNEVKKEDYCLVVYDAYRPQKTIDEFIRWAHDPHDQNMKMYYYPRINKSDLFDLRYLAKRSSHSRGSTLDLTLISKTKKLKNKIEIKKRKSQDNFEYLFLDDGTLDMGSHFDLFDILSHPENEHVDTIYQDRRNYLKKCMEQFGFKGVKEEWWHFTLENELYPDTYFDF